MSVIKKAAFAYRSGKFFEALELYQQAGKLYGESLFYANIMLCNRTIQSVDSKSADKYIPLSEDIDIIKQLTDTQARLEYYFIKCQKLENELANKI